MKVMEWIINQVEKLIYGDREPRLVPMPVRDRSRTSRSGSTQAN